MSITKIIEEIRHLPNTFVDCNYGQGVDVLKKHFAQNKLSIDQLDLYIATSQRQIAELVGMFVPYQLPADYLFFLENYGGLVVSDDKKPILEIFGAGPLADLEYSPVTELNEVPMPYAHKNIYIASYEILLSAEESEILFDTKKTNSILPEVAKKSKPRHQQVSVYLDIQDVIQTNSIIVITDLDVVTKNYKWKQAATSFSEWLGVVLLSGGKFKPS